jgi:hypothetical protein
MSNWKTLLGLPLVACSMVLASASPAEARRGFVLITHGESVKHIADIPSETKPLVRQLTGRDVQAGYYYKSFGIFWLDLWTWGGQYCLYADNDCWELTRDELAELLGKDKSELGKPLFYRFPPGLMIIIAGVALITVLSLRGKRKQKALGNKLQQIAADPRYKRAVQIFAENLERQKAETAAADPSAPAAHQPDGDVAFDEAVRYLTSQAIEKEEATENLGLLLSTLAAAQSEEEE